MPISHRSRWYWIASAVIIYTIVLVLIVFMTGHESTQTDTRALDENYPRAFATAFLEGQLRTVNRQNELQLRLVQLNFAPDGADIIGGLNGICLDEANLWQETTNHTLLRTRLHRIDTRKTPECFDLNETDPMWMKYGFFQFNIDSSDQVWVTPSCFDACADAFRYPFDGTSVKFRVLLSLKLQSGNSRKFVIQDQVFAAIVYSITSAGGWEITGNAHEESPTPSIGALYKGPLTYAALTFKRPLIVQLFVPIVILVVLFFILLMAYVDSLGTFVEGGAAVFFGIIGLKQLLLPGSTDVQTGVDIAISSLYFAFAVMLVRHFVLSIRRLRPGRARQIINGEDETDGNTNPILNRNESRIAYGPNHVAEAERPRSDGMRAFIVFLAIVSVLVWFSDKITRRR